MTIFTSPVTEVEVVSAPDPGIAHEIPGSQTKAEPKVERDNEYYFVEEPMAIFLVENCLFRIHRNFLLEGSEVFRDMFASPAGGISPGGTSNEQPISLSEVTRREFRALLDYFYLPSHVRWRSEGNKEENLKTYTDLLRISHRFLFDETFQYVVEKLQPMITRVPAIQRFALGQKYGLKEWMFSGYEGLLDSETTPTAQELEILGFDKAARLIQAREAVRRRHLQDMTDRCRCTRQVDVVSADPPKPPSKTYIRQFFEP